MEQLLFVEGIIEEINSTNPLKTTIKIDGVFYSFYTRKQDGTYTKCQFALVNDKIQVGDTVKVGYTIRDYNGKQFRNAYTLTRTSDKQPDINAKIKDIEDRILKLETLMVDLRDPAAIDLHSNL